MGAPATGTSLFFSDFQMPPTNPPRHDVMRLSVSSISCPRILNTRDRFKNDSSWTFRGSEEMLAHCLIRRSLISMLRPIILLQGPHLGPCHPARSALHAVKTPGVGTDSQSHSSYYAFCLPSPGSRGCLQLLHSAVQLI